MGENGGNVEEEGHGREESMSQARRGPRVGRRGRL